MNNLQQYIDFYHSVMPQYPNYGPSMFGGVEGAMNQANDAGRALQFALRMAGGNGGMNMSQHTMPNYFAGLGAAPEGVQIGNNPYSQRVMDLQANPYSGQSNAPAMQNYLSRLLK